MTKAEEEREERRKELQIIWGVIRHYGDNDIETNASMHSVEKILSELQDFCFRAQHQSDELDAVHHCLGVLGNHFSNVKGVLEAGMGVYVPKTPAVASKPDPFFFPEDAEEAK